MRIFVAGATGAIGRRLVPSLVKAGHEVTGMARRGGPGVVAADALDREAVRGAVLAARPEVVVSQLSDLKGFGDPKHFLEQYEMTNRLRFEGTANLLAAAGEAGARRFVAQSYTGWPYAREGGPVKTEDDRLDPSPPPAFRPALAAIRRLEDGVTAFPGGVVLRYATFYGPDTFLGKGGPQYEAVRRRQFPLAGGGGAVWSFIHLDDAVQATVAAIESDVTGIFNVADDEPATVAEWLPVMAERMGAKPPRRIPAWLVRLAAGPHTATMLTDLRGVSNAKAKAQLGWRPQHRWRESLGRA
jgi:nucleoside-diphosphate-sugar epimerase